MEIRLTGVFFLCPATFVCFFGWLIWVLSASLSTEQSSFSSMPVFTGAANLRRSLYLIRSVLKQVVSLSYSSVHFSHFSNRFPQVSPFLGVQCHWWRRSLFAQYLLGETLLCHHGIGIWLYNPAEFCYRGFFHTAMIGGDFCFPEIPFLWCFSESAGDGYCRFSISKFYPTNNYFPFPINFDNLC